MARTVGSLVDHFIKAYGLKKQTISPLHDCVHAMTGFGVGEVNEQRISAVIDGLENVRPGPDEELSSGFQDILDMAMQEFIAENGDPMPVFATLTFDLAQKHAAPIDPREAEAYFQLGRAINAAIEKNTGQPFSNVTYQKLAAVDFDKLDFSQQAFDIRSQFETAKNRRVERLSRNVLEQESLRQTGHSDIPPADKPWTLAPGK